MSHDPPNVISLDDIRQAKLQDSQEEFIAIAMCLSCTARWIATITVHTPLFKLQCYQCGDADSFASIVPNDYLRARNLEDSK